MSENENDQGQATTQPPASMQVPDGYQLVADAQVEQWRGFESQANQLQQQVGSLEQTIQGLTGERDAAQDQLTELNTQNANLQAQLTAAAGATEAANQQLTELQQLAGRTRTATGPDQSDRRRSQSITR